MTQRAPRCDNSIWGINPRVSTQPGRKQSIGTGAMKSANRSQVESISINSVQAIILPYGGWSFSNKCIKEKPSFSNLIGLTQLNALMSCNSDLPSIVRREQRSSVPRVRELFPTHIQFPMSLAPSIDQVSRERRSRKARMLGTACVHYNTSSLQYN